MYVDPSDPRAKGKGAIRIKEVSSAPKENIVDGGTRRTPPKPSEPGPKKPKGFGGWFGTGMVLYNAGSTYFDQRAEGTSRLGSLAHAASELILPEFLGWKTHMALGFAPVIAHGVVSGAQNLAQTAREYERAVRDQSPFRTNTFVDSQQIYTMRQAGMALAEQSKYALQQTLIGNEAQYMHR